MAKKEIIRLLDTILDGNVVLPERYISRMDTRPANLPVLRYLASLVDDGKLTRYQIPDYTKVAHTNTLELPSRFARHQFGKDSSGNIFPLDESYIRQYRKLPIKEFSDTPLSNKQVQRSLSDLMRELAALRNPQGVIAYRAPNFMLSSRVGNVDNPKIMGVLSMTKDPIRFVEGNAMEPFIPYLIKPKQLLSDFSKSPLGFPNESEIQTFAPFGAKRLGPAITDYDKLQEYMLRTKI